MHLSSFVAPRFLQTEGSCLFLIGKILHVVCILFQVRRQSLISKETTGNGFTLLRLGGGGGGCAVLKGFVATDNFILACEQNPECYVYA